MIALSEAIFDASATPDLPDGSHCLSAGEEFASPSTLVYFTDRAPETQNVSSIFKKFL